MNLTTNSDSLFNVLAYLNHHPEQIVKLQARYANVVRIFLSDDYPVADSEIYFPKDRLLVNRLSPDFVSKNGDLLDYFYTTAGHKLRGYHDVWATTAHITKKHLYLIDLSYE